MRPPYAFECVCRMGGGGGREGSYSISRQLSYLTLMGRVFTRKCDRALWRLENLGRAYTPRADQLLNQVLEIWRGKVVPWFQSENCSSDWKTGVH